jgi:hypothetical protein
VIAVARIRRREEALVADPALERYAASIDGAAAAATAHDHAPAGAAHA